MCVCCEVIHKICSQTSSCVTRSYSADGVWNCRKGHACVFVCAYCMSHPFNTVCMNNVYLFVSINACLCLCVGCLEVTGSWAAKNKQSGSDRGSVIHSHSSAIFPQQNHISQQQVTLDLPFSLPLSPNVIWPLFKVWGQNQIALGNAKRFFQQTT